MTVSEKDKKKVGKIMQKFQQAKRQRQKYDSKWRELDAFDRGEQWELDGVKVPPWIPKPVTNYIHLVKTTKRAALAVENPHASIMGQSPEDHEQAKSLQKVFDFVWEQMRARLVVRDCLETSKLLGTAIVQVYYEDDGTVRGGKGARYQGEVKIRQIDPASFYPDPNAFRLEDCEYIQVVRRRPIKWVEKEFNVKNIQPSDGAHNELGEIYNRSYSSENKDKIVHLIEHYEKVPDKDNGGFKYQVTFIAGDKVIKDTEQLKPNVYPFAILYDFPQRQDFWAMSTCELVLDNQKLINKVESIMAMIGSLLQNPQKVVFTKSNINPREVTKYGTTPGQTWESDVPASEAMHWIVPPEIPRPLFELANQARENIREITGMNEAYLGQNVGSLQTSSGVNSLIERATMRDRDQMYDFELFIEDLSYIIIRFIIEYYTETRIARILDTPGSEPEFLHYKGSDFKDIEYDITIDVSAKAPISRVRKQEELDRLLTLQGQMQFDPPVITPQEYIEESEFVESEKLLHRMNMHEIQSAEAIMNEVLEMINEAHASGVPEEEIAEMSQVMLQTKFEEKQQGGVGSTAEHSGEMQMRQGQPGAEIGIGI